jgi:3-oxoadipate enol-lactonase
MGGYTAFALLRLAPSRMAGLILCNTKPEADSEEAKNARRDMLASLDREGVEGVADRSLPRLLGATTRRSRSNVEEAVRAIAAGNTADGVRAAIIRLMNRPDSTRLLPSITCPTLVVASDEDVVTPVDQARAMHRAITGSELAIIREAGHLSNLEQPERFTATVCRFLDTRFGD